MAPTPPSSKPFLAVCDNSVERGNKTYLYYSAGTIVGAITGQRYILLTHAQYKSVSGSMQDA